MQGCENISLQLYYYCYLEKYFAYVTRNFEKAHRHISEFDYELRSIYVWILIFLCFHNTVCAKSQTIDRVTNTCDSVMKERAHFNEILFWQVNTEDEKYIHI